MIPTPAYFRQWARQKDIPLPLVGPWLEITYHLQRRRAEEGLPTVPKATRFKDHPKLPRPVTGRLRRYFEVTKEQALESLRRYKEMYTTAAGS